MIHGYHLLSSWQIPAFQSLDRRPISLRAGRGGVCLIEHPKGTIVERAYRHGGLRRLLLPDLFLRSGRARNELKVHQRAFDAGVATSQPVGWREAPTSLPFFRRYYYYTVLLPNAATLPVFLIQQSLSRPLLEAIADILHRLFCLGIYHHDINLNNWLISKQRVYLIDFDQSHEMSWSGLTYLRKASARLARSGKKLGLIDQKKNLLFRLLVTTSHRFGLSARTVLSGLPSHLAKVSLWDRIRWKLSGGHRKLA